MAVRRRGGGEYRRWRVVQPWMINESWKERMKRASEHCANENPSLRGKPNWEAKGKNIG